jgi:hypothetical protein
MDILQALKREEAKLEKQVKNVLKHLNIVRSTVKFFGGSTTAKLDGRKKGSRMSAAARARISKAQKARWAKVRTAKAKPRRNMSSAGRARIVKATKARWARWRAAKAKKAA